MNFSGSHSYSHLSFSSPWQNWDVLVSDLNVRLAILHVYWLWDIRYTGEKDDMVRGCCFVYTFTAFTYPSSKLYVITVLQPEIFAQIFPSNISSKYFKQNIFLRTKLHFQTTTKNYLFYFVENNKSTFYYICIFCNYLKLNFMKNLRNINV